MRRNGPVRAAVARGVSVATEMTSDRGGVSEGPRPCRRCYGNRGRRGPRSWSDLWCLGSGPRASVHAGRPRAPGRREFGRSPQVAASARCPSDALPGSQDGGRAGGRGRLAGGPRPARDWERVTRISVLASPLAAGRPADGASSPRPTARRALVRTALVLGFCNFPPNPTLGGLSPFPVSLLDYVEYI